MVSAVSTATQTPSSEPTNSGRDINTGDGSRSRTRDRELTEARLAQAALEMLKADGVLAGLNLRDVAAAAGVARASIYNFFGSRRQLLRRALAIRIGELQDFHGVSPLPLVDRKMRLIGDEANALHGRLVSLLVIDGDDEVVPMPFFDDAMERMQDDVEQGHIHDDNAGDLEALHIALHTATRGYNLLRIAYARQAGVTVEELDARVRPVFESWLRGLSEPNPDLHAGERKNDET